MREERGRIGERDKRECKKEGEVRLNEKGVESVEREEKREVETGVSKVELERERERERERESGEWRRKKVEIEIF